MGMLNGDQAKLAKAHFEKHNGYAPCPCCGNDQWAIGEIVVAPALAQGGASLDGSRAIPFLGVECKRCAFTRFFAAGSIGLVPGGHR